MKKRIFLFLTVALFCISVLFVSGCENDKGMYEIDIDTVYALAQEKGFEGTIDDLISAFKGDSAYEIAVANGYTGTESEWLESLVGAAGQNGVTPRIEEGYWWVGETNTGVKAVGLSVVDISVIYDIDQSGNEVMIFTYTMSDGSELTSTMIVPKKIIVSFNLNYHDAPVAPAPNLLIKGNKYGELPTVTRDYYTFEGWYKDAASSEEITADTVINDNESHILYAKWEEELQTVTVSFDLNYPDAPDAPSSKEVTVDEKYGILAAPTRNGYIFDGWYLDSNCTGAAVTKDTIVAEYTDHKLYAKWRADKLNVNFMVSGEIFDTVEYDAGSNYGLDIPAPPVYITVGDELLRFQYWYVIIDEEESVIDAYTPLAFDEDHDVNAFYAVAKSLWDFTSANDPDIQYFRLGAQYGESKSGVEREAGTVQYDDDKKALRLSPIDNDVRLITGKMTYDFEYNWEVAYTIEVECDEVDNGKQVNFRLIGKFGGGTGAPVYADLLGSTIIEEILNGETYTISGRTTRDGDTELYLQIKGLEDFANLSALKFYIKEVEIDRDPGPMPTVMVYDMGTAAGRELIALGNQWTEYVGGGGDSNTSVEEDLVKNAVKVSTAREDAGILWVRIFYFNEQPWVEEGTQITWEIEIDAPQATADKIKFSLRGKITGTTTFEDFGEISVDYADGVYTLTGITINDYNRHDLIIDVSELSGADKTSAIFYIKKVTVDTNP